MRRGGKGGCARRAAARAATERLVTPKVAEARTSVKVAPRSSGFGRPAQRPAPGRGRSGGPGRGGAV